MDWINAIVQGVLVGGLYALFAAGLSLIFGVMRLVNIAHGDLIVLAAFIALIIVQGTGLHPLASLVVVVPLMALFGYALQRGVLNRTLGKDILPPSARDIRLVGHPPERASRDLHGRQPQARCRYVGNRELSGGAAAWPSASCHC